MWECQKCKQKCDRNKIKFKKNNYGRYAVCPNCGAEYILIHPSEDILNIFIEKLKKYLLTKGELK